MKMRKYILPLPEDETMGIVVSNGEQLQTLVERLYPDKVIVKAGFSYGTTSGYYIKFTDGSRLKAVECVIDIDDLT